MCKLSSDIPFCALKPFDCICLCLFITKNTDIGFTGLQIRCDFHRNDRGELCHAGIFDSPAQNIGQFMHHFCIDPRVFDTVFSHIFILSWFFYHLECFYLIAFFDVIVFFKYETTFVSCFYFFDIIFETLQ